MAGSFSSKAESGSDRRRPAVRVQAQDFVELNGERSVIDDLDVIPVAVIAHVLCDLGEPYRFILLIGCAGRRRTAALVGGGWEALHEESRVFAGYLGAFVGVCRL